MALRLFSVLVTNVLKLPTTIGFFLYNPPFFSTVHYVISAVLASVAAACSALEWNGMKRR